MYAVPGRGFAAETSGDDAKLILVDEIGDTGEPNACHFRRSIKKIRGHVFEAKNFPKVLTADHVKLL